VEGLQKGAARPTWGGHDRIKVMQPLGVHHVSVNVPDVEKSLKFYTGVLGLTQRSDRPDFGFDGAWLNAGDQQVHLIAATTPPDMGQHLALKVRDMNDIVSELRGVGVEVTEPVVVAGGLQSFLHDPDGNFIELYQPAGV
jgi:glyoxylase I family protein